MGPTPPALLLTGPQPHGVSAAGTKDLISFILVVVWEIVLLLENLFFGSKHQT